MDSDSIHSAAGRSRMSGTTPTRSRRFCAVVIALLALSTSRAAVGSVVVHEDDIQRGHILAKAAGLNQSEGSLSVEIAPITLDLPSGNAYEGLLIVVHDPATGIFWWAHTDAEPDRSKNHLDSLRENVSFFHSEREILSIQLGRIQPSLWLLHSTASVGSVAQARAVAIDGVAKVAASIEEGTVRWFREVNLWHALPKEFFYAPNHAMPKLEMSVASIERRPGGWSIRLHGREDKIAEVWLDDLFTLVDARILDDRSPSDP